MATPAQKKLVQQRLADIRAASNAQPKRFNWTGFSNKTLWDWLQWLATLAIPIVVAFIPIYFGIQQAQLADKQHQNDVQLANDQQEEATLKAYLDDMTTLLLDKKLGSQAVADQTASAEAAVVARAKTLVTLRRLNTERKTTVLQFLYEAHLIGYCGDQSNCKIPVGRIIDLGGAFLNGAELSDADLRGADLSGAILSGAELNSARLDSAYLNGAHLNGALYWLRAPCHAR